jgi:hypothetical protein
MKREKNLPNIARRRFIKKIASAGFGFLLSFSAFPAFLLKGKSRNSFLKQESKQVVCKVKKEIYVPYPEPAKAPWVSMRYVGRGLRREEFRSFMLSSDWNESLQKRTSNDNGRTWSEWLPEPKQEQTRGDYTLSGGAFQGAITYDPVSGKHIKLVFQRIFKGVPQVALKEIWKGNRLFWDHGYYQLSSDNGISWGDIHQLKYENGPDFNPSDWGNKDYLETNEMYIGNIILLKNGNVIVSATIPVPYQDEEDMKFPSIYPNNYRKGCVAGAMCFIGTWDEQKNDYSWKNSNSIFLPRQVSTRGLTELDISELGNGNLLLIMRGSNAGLDISKSPGRKWFSVSKDGGFTWENVSDMRYDTGEQFYSSATISKTIRSSKTGKLYWVGNINNIPPKGNSPRYPLQIIEIDENGPTFKKNTLTVIDDRDVTKDSEFLQLSNFSLFEDRETKNMEIYLTRIGENGGGADIWTANSYKYILEF